MKFFDLKTILILVLLTLLLLTKACGGHAEEQTPNITTIGGKKYQVIEQVVDTVYKTDTVIRYKAGKEIYVNSYPPETPITKVDTNSINVLNSYYTRRVYNDTLKLKDNIGYITINDTICENEIQGRTWKPFIKQITITNKVKVKELPKNQVFIGAVAGFDRVNIVNFVGPSLLLKTKKDNIYSLGVGIGTNRTISLQGGIYWKIKFKK